MRADDSADPERARAFYDPRESCDLVLLYKGVVQYLKKSSIVFYFRSILDIYRFKGQRGAIEIFGRNART